MINAMDENQRKLLDQAWLIISQVSGGNWQAQPPEWRDQAIAFRDQYQDTPTLFPVGGSTMTEFGPATSEPMTWDEALEQLACGKDVIRTGPGGCFIRCHRIRKPIPFLSANSRGHDRVFPWLPCEDDKRATNWVTVYID